MRALVPALALLAVEGAMAKTKRAQHLTRQHRGRTVSIRDQRPLHAGNVALDGGWTFERLIVELNARVFFWPGNVKPIAHGARHFERYRDEAPIVLRARFDEVCAANPDRTPEVCPYNSGSPRFSGGRASPRGPGTFAALDTAQLLPSNVVEVTFRGEVSLPVAVEVAESYAGPWRAF